MFQFIESISLINGVFLNLYYHNKRLNDTMAHHFKHYKPFDLETEIIIPKELKSNTLHKCRIVYSKKIEEVSFSPYFQKKINSIQLVNDNQINYSYKYLDRTDFQILLENNISDEVLIVKDGFITDSSYSNIIFFNGNGWVTPTTFLLNGTQRQKLLEDKCITEKIIDVNSLKEFSKFKLINSMLTFENSFTYDINLIKQ